MKRLLAMLLSGLFVTGAAAPQEETRPQSSAWVHNPRARTESGIEAHRQGEAAIAAEALAAALDLTPTDPLVQYNAGTASLLGAGPEAVPLLQAAAEAAPPELRPTAYYNLGNAHLAGQDPAAAIDTYQRSLRLSPDNLDAKHNLELAQRLLQQHQQQQQQQEQDEQQEQQEQDEQQEQNQGEQEQPQDQDQQEQPSDRALPDFDEQPDMTAEQAAAILEAVENLEREQRRKEALELMKQAGKERDW